MSAGGQRGTQYPPTATVGRQSATAIGSLHLLRARLGAGARDPLASAKPHPALTVIRRLVAVLAVLVLAALVLQTSWASVNGQHSHVNASSAVTSSDDHHNQAGSTEHSHCLTKASAVEPGDATSHYDDNRSGGAHGLVSCDTVSHHWLFGGPSAAAMSIVHTPLLFESRDEQFPSSRRLRPSAKPPKT